MSNTEFIPHNTSFEKVRCALVDTRFRNGATRTKRDEVRSGGYGRLATHIAMHTDAWEQFTDEEKHLALAIAFGLDRRKAVLIGRSAARVLGIPLRPRLNDLVELGLLSGTVPKLSKQPAKAKYYRDPIAPEDVIEVEGVRVVNPLVALVGVHRRGDWVDAVVAADAVKARGFSDEEAAEVFDRIAKGPERRSIKRAWDFAVSHPVSRPEYSAARAMLAERGLRVGANVMNREQFVMPLVVGERTLLTFLDDGPQTLHERFPSKTADYRDLVVGTEAFNQDPQRIIALVQRCVTRPRWAS